MEGQVEPPTEPDPSVLVKHIAAATRILIDTGDEALETLLGEKTDLMKVSIYKKHRFNLRRILLMGSFFVR